MRFGSRTAMSLVGSTMSYCLSPANVTLCSPVDYQECSSSIGEQGRSSSPVGMSVKRWLQSELENRGIDAVIYTRYILSLLKQDSFDCETDDNLFFTRKTGRSNMTTFQRKQTPLSCDDMRKLAAVTCLQSATEEDFDIESLVDELYLKLKKLQATSVQDQRQSIDSEKVYTPMSSNELAAMYYAAFPALSDEETSPTSLKNTSITPGQEAWAAIAQKLPESKSDCDKCDEEKLITIQPRKGGYGFFYKPIDNESSLKKDYINCELSPEDLKKTEALFRAYVGRRFAGRFERVLSEEKQTSQQEEDFGWYTEPIQCLLAPASPIPTKPLYRRVYHDKIELDFSKLGPYLDDTVHPASVLNQPREQSPFEAYGVSHAVPSSTGNCKDKDSMSDTFEDGKNGENMVFSLGGSVIPDSGIENNSLMNSDNSSTDMKPRNIINNNTVWSSEHEHLGNTQKKPGNWMEFLRSASEEIDDANSMNCTQCAQSNDTPDNLSQSFNNVFPAADQRQQQLWESESIPRPDQCATGGLDGWLRRHATDSTFDDDRPASDTYLGLSSNLFYYHSHITSSLLPTPPLALPMSAMVCPSSDGSPAVLWDINQQLTPRKCREDINTPFKDGAATMENIRKYLFDLNIEGNSRPLSEEKHTPSLLLEADSYNSSSSHQLESTMQNNKSIFDENNSWKPRRLFSTDRELFHTSADMDMKSVEAEPSVWHDEAAAVWGQEPVDPAVIWQMDYGSSDIWLPSNPSSAYPSQQPSPRISISEDVSDTLLVQAPNYGAISTCSSKEELHVSENSAFIDSIPTRVAGIPHICSEPLLTSHPKAARSVQIRHLYRYKSELSVLNLPHLDLAIDDEINDSLLEICSEDQTLAYSPSCHFKPIVASALPADNLIPQVDSLCTNIDCSATTLHRCSTHQYYTGEETVTSTFVPKFLCLDRSRDTKAAQTTDVINAEDRDISSESDTENTHMLELLIADVSDVLDLSEDDSHYVMEECCTEIVDTPKHSTQDASSDYESMTHGISTEDISNLAMIWTDDEDVSVQHAALPLGSAHAADTHYKTIWSCGTEQDIPGLCEDYQPPVMQLEESNTNLTVEEDEGYMIPFAQESFIPILNQQMDINEEEYYHQCYTEWSQISDDENHLNTTARLRNQTITEEENEEVIIDDILPAWSRALEDLHEAHSDVWHPVHENQSDPWQSLHHNHQSDVLHGWRHDDHDHAPHEWSQAQEEFLDDIPVWEDEEELSETKEISSVIFSNILEQHWMTNEDLLDSIQPSKKTLKAKTGCFNEKPCSFYLEGNCQRENCKYSHQFSNITCRFWEEGDCFKGVTCPFLHGYANSQDEEGCSNNDSSSAVVSEEEFQLVHEDFPDLISNSSVIKEKKALISKSVKNSSQPVLKKSSIKSSMKTSDSDSGTKHSTSTGSSEGESLNPEQSSEQSGEQSCEQSCGSKVMNGNAGDTRVPRPLGDSSNTIITDSKVLKRKINRLSNKKRQEREARRKNNRKTMSSVYPLEAV